MKIEQKVILTRKELKNLLTTAWEYGCRHHNDTAEKSRDVNVILSTTMGEIKND